MKSTKRDFTTPEQAQAVSGAAAIDPCAHRAPVGPVPASPAEELSLRSRLLTARSCIAAARWALVEASTSTKQKVRNSKADYAAMCLLLAAQQIRKAA